MKNSYLVRLSTAILMITSLLLATGCGYKNAPLPPESVVPEAIGDLLYKVDENGVKLSWSYPVKTIKGEVVEDISSFDLYMAEIALEEYCATCPVPFKTVIEVAGGVPFDGTLRRKASYDSSLLRTGHKYFFKVRSRSSWLASSSDSNIVTFVWFKPAAAPKELQAVAGDRHVSLSWQPVTTLANGRALDMPLKYQVLRSAGGKDFVKVGAPIAATEYEDKQVRNGQKYFYTVQSMTLHEEELVNGGVSQDIAVVPVDLTPPLPPAGVTAVGTGVGVKIFWDRNDGADIGGYKIYRRSADSDDYILIGDVKPEYTLFVDNKGDDSVRYYYAVTAFDQAKQPNESNKSREATVRH